MKILCVSDQIDPLIYSQNARCNFPDIDLVLCAGDLPMDYVDFIVTVLNKPTYFVFGNHNLNEYKYYHGSKDEREENLLYSKHNHGAVYAGFKVIVIKDKHLKIADEKTKKEKPLIIAGVSGSMRYNNGLCQWTDSQMKMRLLLMVPKLLVNKLLYGKYLDIFLTHAPPKNIHDKNDPCHVGFDCYNWFIKKFCPKYLIHGHIHLYDQREERSGKYFDTTVVNAFAHCVVEI